MTEQVVVEQHYPADPSLVWKAMTDAEVLRLWFEDVDLKPEVGHRFVGAGKRGKVIEVEHERLLAFQWEDDDDGTSSVVVWRLDPTDGGTRVTVEERKVEEPEVVCLSNYWPECFDIRLMFALNLLKWLGFRVEVMA